MFTGATQILILRAIFSRDKQPGREAHSTLFHLIIGNTRGNLPPCPTGLHEKMEIRLHFVFVTETKVNAS
jgi:hypothetical protein